MAALEGQKPEAKRVPLCVDLDGTLIKSDLLFETLRCLLKSNPLAIFMVPLWFLRGRAYLKRRLAQVVDLKLDLIPLNTELLDFLKRRRLEGQELYLVSASAEALVEKFARQVGIFAGWYGSSGDRNLKGHIKCEFLVNQFGAKNFEYVGDSRADLEVWKQARCGYVVTGDPRFTAAVGVCCEVGGEFHIRAVSLQTVVRAVRVHQWVKNLLIFVPVMMAHSALTGDLLFRAFVAFFSFSFCASAVYLLNDLMDLDADRMHPSKKRRPFASGELSLAFGLFLIPLLIGSSFALALAALPMDFLAILAIYFLLTSAYSLALKSIAIIDIVLLAGLYTIRILAGGEACGVPVSHWLLGFSTFIFLSLACVKRYSELISLAERDLDHIQGRGYRKGDEQVIGWLGTSSGYLSVLVLALYINSAEVVALYRRPDLLWFVCPVVLYWISRVWLLVHRDQLHEDPIVFALQDKVSYFAGAMAALIIVLAI